MQERAQTLLKSNPSESKENVWRNGILLVLLVSVGLAFDRGDVPVRAGASTRQLKGEFNFVRLIYSGGNELDNWTTDYPKADRQL
ncbi:MAG: hypothetical protein EHM23_02680, partial [Acidobacteria bacterium]